MTRAKRSQGVASTRDRLIDAAFRVVARDGLADASVKAIAADAGITPGLLHYHFASKDALLQAAVLRGLEDYLAELDRIIAGPPGQSVIDRYVAFTRDGLDGHRDLFRVRLGLAVRAMNDPDLAAAIASANERAHRRIATIFGLAGGRPQPDDRDVLIARTVKASFEGMMLSWLSQPDFPMHDVFDTWQRAVQAMLPR